MTETFIQELIQGGLASVALASLALIYKLVTNHFLHTNEIIGKNTDAYAKLVESNTKLCGSIDSLEKTVQSKL